MSNSVLDFWWYVPETAFFWTDAPALNAGPGRRLTTGLPMEAADHVRGYRPFDGGRLSGLFRQFAATKPTEAGILSFASSYGCLLDPERQDIISFTPDTEAPYYGYGEPLALWRAQIQLMRTAVTLWKAIVDSDIRWIRERMIVQPERRELKPGEVSLGPMRMARFVSDDVEGPYLYLNLEAESILTPFDWRRLARLYILHLVNMSLKDHVSPRMLFDTETDHLQIRLCPANLLGAMWLQLALAIDGKKEFRACRTCGIWFELDPKKNRRSRFYCSNACRSKSLREREAKAQRLYHDEGWTIEQIASELGSSPAVVHGWVTKNT